MDNDGIDHATHYTTTRARGESICEGTKARRATLLADLPLSAVAHRESFVRLVLDEAELWHRTHLGRLHAYWHEWNAAFFCGQMVAPFILLSEACGVDALGLWAPGPGHGVKSQIRIFRSIQFGTDKQFYPVWGQNDLDRFVEDILLHEMLHQWAQEITGELDDDYHGHGPAFRDKANEIGDQLGFPPVRTCKRRGPDAELPSCSQWPFNVRPAGYYPEPFEDVRELRRSSPRDPVIDYLGDWAFSYHRLIDYLDTAIDDEHRENLAGVEAMRAYPGTAFADERRALLALVRPR